MARKTLILNGSPRPSGNTAALINALKKHLQGEIIEISAFRSHIAPCVDCRSCWQTAQCVVKDEMQTIYQDDYDNVVIASPVYFGTLPGPLLGIISRMQPWHAATYFLKQPPVQRLKKAAVILTAGSRGNHEMALRNCYPLFKMLNAHGIEDHVVYSPLTDTLPAWEDHEALAACRCLARWLNEDEQKGDISS